MCSPLFLQHTSTSAGWESVFQVLTRELVWPYHEGKPKLSKIIAKSLGRLRSGDLVQPAERKNWVKHTSKEKCERRIVLTEMN